MIPTKPRLSPSEIVMIELMKLDAKFDDYHEDVDMSVPFEVRESYEAAPELYLPRLLAERAKLYCCKKMGMPVDDIQSRWVRWLAWLSVFTLGSFLFFAVLTALGVPAMFFSGENREASVLAVSVLIGVMAFPCLLPLLSLLSLVFQRLIGRPQAVIADAILWIIRAIRDGWASIRGLPLPSQQLESTRFQEVFRRNSYFASASSVFLSNLYFVLMGIAIWGVLWLFLFSRNVNYIHESSLSTAEERAFFIESVGRPVTFITGTPAPGPTEMRWAAEGEEFVFDEKRFFREVDGVLQPWSKNEVVTYKRNTIESFRRTWSRFLLSSVWTWVFLPRVAVAIIAGVCMLWFYGDFRPKHADPKNRRIVEHVRRRQSHVEEFYVEQVDPDRVPETVLESSLSVQRTDGLSSEDPSAVTRNTVADVTASELNPAPQDLKQGDHVNETAATQFRRAKSGQHSAKKADKKLQAASGTLNRNLQSSTPCIVDTRHDLNASHEPTPDQPKKAEPPKPHIRSEAFAVVGFGLGKNGVTSTSRLAKMGKGMRDFGNLNGAKEQLRFRTAWKNDDSGETTLVVLASLTSVPTVSFGDFLLDLVDCARRRSSGNHPSIKIVLTDGMEARKRLARDADVFETRVSQWIGRILETGIDKSSVLEFDVSSEDGAMAAMNKLVPNTREILLGRLVVAGKTAEAVNIVRRRFNQLLARESETEVAVNWMKEHALISQDLSILYREQKVSLLQFLDSKKCSERVKNAIDGCDLPAGIIPGELQTLAKSMELFRTVSPHWIAAGAMGGLGLGAAAGIAVLASGGLAAIPFIMPTIISSTLGGAVAAQLAKTFAMTTWSKDASKRDAVAVADSFSTAAKETLQACLLQIIVFELQGNAESEITVQLRDQTLRLDRHDVRSLSDVEDLLCDFQEGMLALRGLKDGI